MLRLGISEEEKVKLGKKKIHQGGSFTYLGSIKQFVVTNCIKERPGPIVNKTLKSGILTLIDASKELDFHADFKYISFIN